MFPHRNCKTLKEEVKYLHKIEAFTINLIIVQEKSSEIYFGLARCIYKERKCPSVKKFYLRKHSVHINEIWYWGAGLCKYLSRATLLYVRLYQNY
jgi:hypothetical protein